MKKIKPILFSTPMVQAILEGRKTQTRREIKLPVIENANYAGGAYIVDSKGNRAAVGSEDLPSKYKKGDILWVRETWFPTRYDYLDMLGRGLTHFIKFKADNDYDPKRDCVGRSWKPSIHMPKAACRIFLEVTNVRAERLQDISEADAKAEGVKRIGSNVFDEALYHNYLWDEEYIAQGFKKPASSFASLWNSIHGEDSWYGKHYVFVYEFTRTNQPSNF